MTDHDPHEGPDYVGGSADANPDPVDHTATPPNEEEYGYTVGHDRDDEENTNSPKHASKDEGLVGTLREPVKKWAAGFGTIPELVRETGRQLNGRDTREYHDYNDSIVDTAKKGVRAVEHEFTELGKSTAMEDTRKAFSEAVDSTRQALEETGVVDAVKGLVGKAFDKISGPRAPRSDTHNSDREAGDIIDGEIVTSHGEHHDTEGGGR